MATDLVLVHGAILQVRDLRGGIRRVYSLPNSILWAVVDAIILGGGDGRPIYIYYIIAAAIVYSCIYRHGRDTAAISICAKTEAIA